MAAPDSPYKLNLNLLFPQGIPEKLPIRFIKWLIGYGRFIAIMVEMIVLITFVLRFKFDADLSSVNDKINSQVPFIESLNQDEAKIRQTQFKLSTIKETWASFPDFPGLLNRISGQLPTQVVLTNINFGYPDGKLGFRLNGQTSSTTDLAALVASLKRDSGFSNVSLTSLSFEQGQIIFVITGDIKWIQNCPATTLLSNH